MERTQIYFPENLKQRLQRYAATQNKPVSEIIRDAAEEYLVERERAQMDRDDDFKKVMDQVFGMWKDRDPEEFAEIRRSLDRRLDEWGV